MTEYNIEALIATEIFLLPEEYQEEARKAVYDYINDDVITDGLSEGAKQYLDFFTKRHNLMLFLNSLNKEQ